MPDWYEYIIEEPDWKRKESHVNKEHEATLIYRIQRQYDREAAGLLIGAYYREIYAFTYKQIGCAEQAKDITQEIFISALQSISRYNFSVASFRTWLYRIASNKIVDYFRSIHYKQRQIEINIDDVCAAVNDSLEDLYIDKENIYMVLSAMHELPFESQQIVRMKVYAERTFREIADVLDISENTVKTKYYAALKKIREKVE